MMIKQSSGGSSPLEVLNEISRLLDCPLDGETLSIAIQLLDHGVNPEALAAVITELQNETRRIRNSN